jgi:predicted enzyme related to lactoylglutathione lyase
MMLNLILSNSDGHLSPENATSLLHGLVKPNVPVWLVYVQVADIEQSLTQFTLGGEVLKRAMMEDGTVIYAVIKDPAGAILGLMPTHEAS